MPFYLPALGLLAGALTTIAGMGGGVLLLLALSLLVPPAEALAMTAPALLVGNVSRLISHRAEVDRRVALTFAAGALPGSFLGGLAAASLPDMALRVILVVTTAFAVARAKGLIRLTPPTAALFPAGLGIGAAAATGSGAGLLVGPLLIARGLTGAPYVGTMAGIAVSLHIGRLAAYGAGGLLTRATMTWAAVLAVAIVAGDRAGRRIRHRIRAEHARRLELGTLVVCATLAVLGFR